MELRSHCKVEMAQKDVTKVAHSVTNFKSALTPFPGCINGQLAQPVEVFIDSIENHLKNKSITDPHDQLIEACVHLDFFKGDLGSASRSKAYRECETWEDLKAFLRERYGSSKTQNIVIFFRSIFKLLDRKGDSYLNQGALINDKVVELIKKLENSNWIDGETKKGKNAISMNNLETLLLLAFGLGTLPDELVGHFDADFGPKSNENLILNQIDKHITKMQWVDHSIVNGKRAEKQSPKQIASTNASGSQTNQSSNRTQRKSFRCFNCNKEGHVKKDCNVKYCSFHNTNSHRWKDCYSQKRSRSRVRDNRYSDANSSRERSQSSYRKTDQNRAAATNETGNQSKECVDAQSPDFRQGQNKVGSG